MPYTNMIMCSVRKLLYKKTISGEKKMTSRRKLATRPISAQRFFQLRETSRRLPFSTNRYNTPLDFQRLLGYITSYTQTEFNMAVFVAGFIFMGLLLTITAIAERN